MTESNVRTRVLQTLFPRPPRHASLRFDHESQRYLVELDVERENVSQSEREVVCAVCLDPIEDNCVASGYACDHTYHYDCLMDWIQHDHDDCPQCRRLLWSPLEYQRIALRQRQQGHPERSLRSAQRITLSSVENSVILDVPRNTEAPRIPRCSETSICVSVIAVLAVLGVVWGTQIYASSAAPVSQDTANAADLAIRCSSSALYSSSFTVGTSYFNHTNGGSRLASVCEQRCREDASRCNSWMTRDSGNICFLSEEVTLTPLPPGDFDHHAFTMNEACCDDPRGALCTNDIER